MKTYKETIIERAEWSYWRFYKYYFRADCIGYLEDLAEAVGCVVVSIIALVKVAFLVLYFPLWVIVIRPIYVYLCKKRFKNTAEQFLSGVDLNDTAINDYCCRKGR